MNTEEAWSRFGLPAFGVTITLEQLSSSHFFDCSTKQDSQRMKDISRLKMVVNRIFELFSLNISIDRLSLDDTVLIQWLFIQ